MGMSSWRQVKTADRCGGRRFVALFVNEAVNPALIGDVETWNIRGFLSFMGGVCMTS